MAKLKKHSKIGVYPLKQGNTHLDSTYTKTARYLFFLELCNYHSTALHDAFEKLQPVPGIDTFDHINVYVQDINIKDYDLNNPPNGRYQYFVKVDTRNPQFNKYLDVIKNDFSYVDSYKYKDDPNDPYSIIRISVINTDKFKKLLESKYSQIWTQQELERLSMNYLVTRKYVIDPKAYPLHDSKFEEEADFLNQSWHILAKSDAYINLLLRKCKPDYNLEEKLKAKEAELDTKFNIQKESLGYEIN
jgi:hypothetical protein